MQDKPSHNRSVSPIGNANHVAEPFAVSSQIHTPPTTTSSPAGQQWIEELVEDPERWDGLS
jgi:hypothetical protein